MMMSILRYVGTRNWLRLGLRRRIVKAFYSDSASPDRDFAVRFFGIIYRGRISNFIEWNIFFFGGYELKEAAAMTDILRQIPDPVCLDVGANLGNHTFMLSLNSNKVHAFEPYSPLADSLEDQISRNGVSNISVYRVGLGADQGVLSYFLDTHSANSGTGSFISDHTGAGMAAMLPVQRGDFLLDGVTADLIKVDVEGFEGSVLLGLRDLIFRSEPIVVMEITKTALREIEGRGGFASLFPYSFRTFEIINPIFPFGIFQSEKYRLRLLKSVHARPSSFNIMIIPERRALLLERLQCGSVI